MKTLPYIAAGLLLFSLAATAVSGAIERGSATTKVVGIATLAVWLLFLLFVGKMQPPRRR